MAYNPHCSKNIGIPYTTDRQIRLKKHKGGDKLSWLESPLLTFTSRTDLGNYPHYHLYRLIAPPPMLMTSSSAFPTPSLPPLSSSEFLTIPSHHFYRVRQLSICRQYLLERPLTVRVHLDVTVLSLRTPTPLCPSSSRFF